MDGELMWYRLSHGLVTYLGGTSIFFYDTFQFLKKTTFWTRKNLVRLLLNKNSFSYRVRLYKSDCFFKYMELKKKTTYFSIFGRLPLNFSPPTNPWDIDGLSSML